MLRIERRLFWLFLHVALAALAIHYFLTPFEVGAGGATPYTQRLFFGFVFLLLIGLGGRLEKRAEVLFLFFIVTAVWFVSINFPENIGSLLYFLAFLGPDNLHHHNSHRLVTSKSCIIPPGHRFRWYTDRCRHSRSRQCTLQVHPNFHHRSEEWRP